MPPQSFAEQAFFETSDPSTTEPAGSPPIGSRMAGASQVVFRIAASELPLKYSLESILATLTRSAQVVSTRIAQPPGVPGVDGTAFFGGLRGQFTAVEAPFRLVLSPSSQSRWEHAVKAVAASTGRRVELWHTRLSAQSTARAVFSPDYVPAPGKPPDANTIFPFLMSLREYDRHRLVRVTADPALPGRRSADVDFLALSSLGAWLNIHGQWETSLGLAEWRHLLTMGRDEYVPRGRRRGALRNGPPRGAPHDHRAQDRADQEQLDGGQPRRVPAAVENHHRARADENVRPSPRPLSPAHDQEPRHAEAGKARVLADRRAG